MRETKGTNRYFDKFRKLKSDNPKRYALLFGLITAIIVLAISLLLDVLNTPSGIAHFLDRLFSVSFFSKVFMILRTFMINWGNLATFLIGFLIGFLIPTISELNSIKIKDHTKQIRDYIRGNLLTFDDVYYRICDLLEIAQDDPNSCFVLVSQSPLIGIDIWSRHDQTYKYWCLLLNRISAKNACRFVCLSPFGSSGMMVNDSLTGQFYNYLEEYNPPKFGSTRVGEQRRNVDEMFTDTKEFFKVAFASNSVDIIFRDTIPYQVYLVRKGNGTKICVLLMSGQEAIKRNLPSGGFVSEDLSFIQLIEDSVKALVGVDRDPYELRHTHTKDILEKAKIYASTHMGDPSDLSTIDLDNLDSFSFEGVSLTLWPYVFDPRAAESSSIVASRLRKIFQQLKSPVKKPIVFDIGCGSGLLGIIAAKMGASEVFAVDHNPIAVKCSEYNFLQNNVNGKVLEGNLFDPIKQKYGSKKADIIVADLPFLDCYPYAEDKNEKIIQSAYFDFEQKSNLEFLHLAHEYLAPDGYVILSFSNLDSVSEFERNIEDLGWHIAEHTRKGTKQNSYRWFAYLLTHVSRP